MKIFLDTETTGLLETNISDDPAKQPRIIEFAAIKTGSDLKEIARLEFLCKVPEKLDEKIIKLTNITQDMLANQRPFQAYYESLCDFFLGVDTLVAHNLPFDVNILFFELKRLNKHCQFPWPPNHECTMEMTEGEESRKLGNLYAKYFGEPIEGAHRAITDVEALIKIYEKITK